MIASLVETGRALATQAVQDTVKKELNTVDQSTTVDMKVTSIICNESTTFLKHTASIKSAEEKSPSHLIKKLEASSEPVQQMVRVCFDSLGKGMTSKISERDFRRWCQKENSVCDVIVFYARLLLKEKAA